MSNKRGHDDSPTTVPTRVMNETQVKEILRALGWTQKEIAEYWGVTQVWLNRLVKNRNGERKLRDDCAFRGLPQK